MPKDVVVSKISKSANGASSVSANSTAVIAGAGEDTSVNSDINIEQSQAMKTLEREASTPTSWLQSYNSLLKAVVVFGFGTAALIAAQTTGTFLSLARWWRGERDRLSGLHDEDARDVMANAAKDELVAYASDGDSYASVALTTQHAGATIKRSDDLVDELAFSAHVASRRDSVAKLTDFQELSIISKKVTGTVKSSNALQSYKRSESGNDEGLHPVLFDMINPCYSKYGDEITVSTYASGSSDPAITSLPNGQFVVTWRGWGSEKVFIQIFNGNGTKYITEFWVDTDHECTDVRVSIASLPNGKFVVTWDRDFFHIFAQMFNNNGTNYGVQFQVNTDNTTAQIQRRFPSITSLPDGKFVVVWVSGTPDNNCFGSIQIFNSDGMKYGTEFQFKTYKNITSSFIPIITSLPNGQFVVAWMHRDYLDQNKYSYGIFAQIFNGDGTKYGTEFQINRGAARIDSTAITSLPSGQFVMAWMEGEKRTSINVFAQIFNGNGIKYGAEFQVNTDSVSEHLFHMFPAMTSLPNGQFVVTWTSLYLDDSSYGIFAQIFYGNGMKYGTEFQIDTGATSNPWSSTITSLPNEKFVVAWRDQKEQLAGVYAQMFSTINTILSTTSSTEVIFFFTGNAPIVIDPNIIVSYDDIVACDNKNSVNATVSITKNFVPNEDRLYFTDQNGIHGIFNVERGILSLIGGSIDNYQLALRRVNYANILSNPSISERIITFIINNRGTNSNTIVRKIDVKQGNMQPLSPSSLWNIIAPIAGGIAASALLGGCAFFAYRDHRYSLKKLEQGSRDKKPLVQEIALQMLGFFGRVSKDDESINLISNIEKFVEILEQNGISDISGRGKAVSKLAKIIAHHLEPYVIAERGCCLTPYSLFGRKIKSLKIDQANIIELVETIKQDFRATQRSNEDQVIEINPLRQKSAVELKIPLLSAE